MPGPPPTFSLSLVPDKRLLFHFSALSFNAHEIHLNQTYAREVEGYPDVLVQGPLLLALVLKVIEARIGELGGKLVFKRLDYRNLRPLFVGGIVRVCLRERTRKNGGQAAQGEEEMWDVWVEGPDEGLAVKGVARLGRGVRDE